MIAVHIIKQKKRMEVVATFIHVKLGTIPPTFLIALELLLFINTMTLAFKLAVSSLLKVCLHVPSSSANDRITTHDPIKLLRVYYRLVSGWLYICTTAPNITGS
jgi:hypothetical protein